ncbi:DUF445 domain-containing protein [Aminicella lysinilytica]|uniref:Uncharacterized membrane protein YheB (UPF0754 family) n=1 Tax=Aminicella lysinilytica TaxID=433323 RepID=A0A4R6Q3R2_9FIRM|nr:DUF445 family protein [Aminicella lysinilytica]TDP54569.1 uncharacterized membrane protein YheB (UPF0754 family) [Aminicella lysinilytica]
MNWSLIAGPIIGAIIGYCTNYIAVKMLFRPLEPIYVFGKRLPFTPGIIPKSKDRIAVAVGNAVGGGLLTQEALEKTLLAPELKEKLRLRINAVIRKESQDERLVRDVIIFYVDGDEFDGMLEKGEDKVASVIAQKVIEMDIGRLVADEAINAIKEQRVGSVVTRLFSDEFLYTLISPISDKVDAMVKERGVELVKQKIHEEFQSFEEKTVGDLFTAIEKSGIDVGQSMVNAYEVFIKKRLESILKNIDIAQIVKDKMDSMDAGEVEELALSVMKKELNAIVNLGALIGFILGCVNIFFNL